MPEPRSGIWAAESSTGGERHVYMLSLEVTRKLEKDHLPATAVRGFVSAAKYGELGYEEKCYVDVADLRPSDSLAVSADCARPHQGPTNSPAEFAHVDLRVSEDGGQVEVTWLHRGETTVLRFRRLSQDLHSRFEGDWVCGEPGHSQYSILHIYGAGPINDVPGDFHELDPDHLLATLDRTSVSDYEGIYGQLIGIAYSHQGDDVNLVGGFASGGGYIGKIDDLKHRITFVPQRRCSVFSRVDGANQ